MPFAPLDLTFYADNAVNVAKRLLGMGLIVVPEASEPLVIAITEVEAYLGAKDPASHTYNGQTQRNRTMFRGGGHCYVYFTYGMHFCMNVVTGQPGDGCAVLLRSGEPLAGFDVLARNRGLTLDGKRATMRNLVSGPAKLTQALGIKLSDDGRLFTDPRLYLADLGRGPKAQDIVRTPRIGISKAKDELLRFVVKDSAWLSR